MGRIIRRREEVQEVSENVVYERVEAKTKQKTLKLKGVTKENNSPILGKKSPIVKTFKRMALVDKTNKSSPPRHLELSEHVPLRRAGAPIPKLCAVPHKVVEMPVEDSKADAPATSVDIDKMNSVPRYRVSPIERPVTRSRKSAQTGGKENKSKGRGNKRKKEAGGRSNGDGDNLEMTARAVVQELQSGDESPVKEFSKPLTTRTLEEKLDFGYAISSRNEQPDTNLKPEATDQDVGLPSTTKRGDGGDYKPDAPAILIDRDKPNCTPRYRMSPIERPVTRSRKPVQIGGKENKSKVNKQKKEVEKKGDRDGDNLENTACAVVQELRSGDKCPAKESSKPLTTQTLTEKLDFGNTLSSTNGKFDSIPKSKATDEDVSLPSTVKVRPVRKRKQIAVKKEDEAAGVNEKKDLSKSDCVKEHITDACAYCRGFDGSCTCHKIAETPLSNIRPGTSSKVNVTPSELQKTTEVSKRNDGPLLEPTSSCSRSSVTPFRKPRLPKLSSEGKKPLTSPLPKITSPSIFSIFKKPDAPRRNSSENKIFVSSLKTTPSTNLRSKNPVYANKNMTPLRRRSSLALQQKEELYEFEVDESEPKPKKKQRRIMKIQRIRPHKKKKLNVYVPDPVMEMRLLRNLDLSPSVLEQRKITEKDETTPASNQPSTSTQGVEMPASACDPLAKTDSAAEDRKAPSSDGGIYDVYMDDDHHGDSGPDPCLSSPCSKYGSSTPLHSALNKSRDSLLDDSMQRFGALSAKLYSPVKSKASPIPVLLENYHNDPVRNGDSDKGSVATNTTVLSGNATYQHDLDISASTPVKFHKLDSSPFVRKPLKPAELNVSNCFGFDEPELMEEPLVSPIKTTIYVPPPPARADRIIKKKLCVPPPTQPAQVDVQEVIKKLRTEVGENSTASTSLANLSVFEDTDVSPKKRSPMKRYLQSENDEVPEKVDMDSLLGSAPSPAKIPRLSYQRLKPKRKVAIAEQSVMDKSIHSKSSDSESSDSECDDGGPAEIPFEIPAHKVVKKPKGTPKKKEAPKKKERGMTKKKVEEEELEKWAKMFNSQCDQVEGFGLCVE